MGRIIIIDENNGQEFITELAESVIAILESKGKLLSNQQNASEWVDDIEAKQILGYRSKTKLQELRSTRAIVFSKYGRKIKYLRQSLIDFLEQHKKTNTF